MKGFLHHLRRATAVASWALVASACSIYQPVGKGSNVPWAEGLAQRPAAAPTPTAAAPTTVAAAEVSRDAPERRHVVERGDRLIGLARHYGVGVTVLAEANQLTPPYVIYVGQTLRVPKASQSRARRTETIASRPDVRYEVRRGDTLSSIARRHDVTVAQLASLNDISPPYRVLVGQTLTVDGSGPSSTRSAKSAQAIADAPPPPLSGKGWLWPVNGKVVGKFGPTGQGQRRDGIDIAAAKGSPVLAAEDGVVVYAGEGVGSYGRLILLRHDGDYITTYAHNAALLVAVGDVVRRGQVIARVGDSGDAVRSQLHFELRKGRRPVDPEKLLVEHATEVASAQ